jgi:tellurite resistance protein
MRPWVKVGVNEITAEWLRNMHPLRIQRWAFSDMNPFCWPLWWMAPWVRMYRKPVAADNPFLKLEKVYSAMIETWLNWYRDMRDLNQEACFKALYGNSVAKKAFQQCRTLLPDAVSQSVQEAADCLNPENEWARKAALTGGYAEAAVRIMIAVTGAGRMLEKSQFQAAQAIVQADPLLKCYQPAQYKAMVKEQARILQLEPQYGLEALASLLPERKDRVAALAIAQRIARSDGVVVPAEALVIERIQAALGLGDLVK